MGAIREALDLIKNPATRDGIVDLVDSSLVKLALKGSTKTEADAARHAMLAEFKQTPLQGDTVQSRLAQGNSRAKSIDAPGQPGGLVSLSTLAGDMHSFPTAYQFKSQLNGRTAADFPDAFESTKLTPERLSQKLNGLASMLRSVDGMSGPKKGGIAALDIGMPRFAVQLGSQAVAVEKAGLGETANVYRLSLAGEHFAFKVPTDPVRIDTHSTAAESGALTFLQDRHQFSDLVRFHGANAAPDGGWMLTEYLGGNTARSGSRVADVLKTYGLKFTDDFSYNRGPGDVAWDVGGIEPANEYRPSTLSEFKAYLATPDGIRAAGRRAGDIDNREELRQALMLALDHPEVTGQVPRTAAYYLGDNRYLHQVLSKAINTDGAAGRAAYELERLRGYDGLDELIHRGIRNPQSRIEAAKKIDRLPSSQIKPAFDAAFEYPESRPMAARAIPLLKESSEQKRAIAAAEADAGARFVLSRMQARGLTMGRTSAEALDEFAQSHGLTVADH